MYSELDTLIIFLKEFYEKVDFEKKNHQQTTKMREKISQAHKVWMYSKHDTLIIFLKEVYEKVDFEKKISRRQKSRKISKGNTLSTDVLRTKVTPLALLDMSAWELIRSFKEYAIMRTRISARGYKTFFMLNSTEHKISTAHKN